LNPLNWESCFLSSIPPLLILTKVHQRHSWLGVELEGIYFKAVIVPEVEASGLAASEVRAFCCHAFLDS
jgi:hypothetical protein